MKMDYAERARALVGTPFRPQGRNEAALDCVGVVLATFRIPAADIPCNYQLRGDHLHMAIDALPSVFRRISKSQLREGDLMFLQPGPRQLHLAVATERGFVHAHAGIGRVVETPGMPEWPLLRVYRKRRR